jgi:magnesium chelatase family protein
MEHPKSTFKIHSCFRDGTLPAWIEVEIHACFQIPGLQILGLPAPEIREAKERILAAFPASGFEFPRKKVTINLAPSSIPKWGTAHDLPIALRILSLVEALPPGPPVLANGELGLDGGVRSTGSPALLMELLLNDPRPDGFRVILAEDDHRAYLNLIRWRQQRSLPLPRNTRVFRISHFSQIRKVLSETDIPVLPAPTADERPRERNATTVAHPHLLAPGPRLERILTLASIGRHHTLLLGPKGIGKSESLAWFRTLAGEPDPQDSWTRIVHQESRNEAPDPGLPARRVHSQVKPQHLLGSFGPKGYRAGELALSHGGFLFADEFMEWSRDSKESLREPLEARSFRLTRVQGSVEVPCDLQLVATGNLCPCGGLPVELARLIPGSKGNCRCPPGITRAYLSRLSGPILDRIDLPVLLRAESGQNTEKNPEDRIHEAVNKGRKFALEHFGVLPSRISAAGLEADLSNPGIRSLLDAASPSLRFRHKTLRVAKSIQAHEQSTRLEAHHVLEALALRELDTHLGNG